MTLRRVLFALAVVALIAVMSIAAITGLDVPPRMLFADPAAFAGEPPYLGMFSALTIMGWTAGAACALFGAWVAGAEVPGRKTLLFLGLLTAWLAIDDQFQLHETVGPDHLGIPQPVFFIAYALIAIALTVWHRTTIGRGPFLYLAAAIALLGFSVMIDMVGDALVLLDAIGAVVAIEEGAKLAGAVLWAAYLVGLARTVLAAEPPR